jgi:chromosome segregation ATPase
MKMPKGSKRSDAEDRARFQLAEANADFLEAQDRKNEYMAEMSAARIAMGALQAARSRLDGARSQVKALDQNAPGCYQSEAATLQGVQKQLDERQQRASAELAKADTLRGSLGEIEAVKTQITDALLRAAKLRSVP